jgi:uncharacterized OsmC-like protein
MTDAQTIVLKVEHGPALTTFEPTTFVKPRSGEVMRFEVNLRAESGEGMIKTAVVEPNLPSWSAFQLRCDEGTALGGTDTAPPPLGYMAAGIAFCLLTHLTAHARANKLSLRGIAIEQRMSFATTLVTDAEAEGDFRGECEGITTHVIVDGDEDEDAIRKMLMESERSCMAMQSLINQVQKDTQLHHNGRALGSLT